VLTFPGGNRVAAARKIAIGIAFIVLPQWLAAQAAPGVRVWLDTLRLPSYRLGEPATLPQFAAWTPDDSNYPYPLLKNFTRQREERAWRSLNLENQYLHCRVLPDLGGHLYSCRDKRNGREMFYANPVVKPANVGLRGAWVAMGIESSFPEGHTRLNIAPVDFALGSAPDGSGVATVEAMDRLSGMEWRVEFILRPASTVLEQRVLLYNRSSQSWPYDWWANAGITLDDPATRFVLPAHVVSSHTTPPERVAWPVQIGGKDGTAAANYQQETAWFAYHSREPFFAVYKPGSRSGVAHFADARAVPGKKIWTWGASQDRWVQSELTDAFPSYVEMQGGVFEDQNTFQFLDPEQFRAFLESWIPLYDVGGVSRVTRDAVLNLQRRGSTLAVELSATRAIPDALIRIFTAGGKVEEIRTALDPSATWRRDIENPAASPYTVELADATGAILLRHTEGVYDADTPDQVALGKIPATDWTKMPPSEALYLDRGKDEELHQHRFAAFTDYTEGLRRYPSSVALKRAAGRFFLSLNRFGEAADLLAKVAEGSPSDAESIYDLGAAQALGGHDREAAVTLARVGADSPFGRAAALQLALIAARGGDAAGALARLKPLLEDHNGPVRAGALEVALLRRLGRNEEAKAALAVWRADDPADSMLRLENTRFGAADDDLSRHLSADAERVLDLVDEYLSLGMEAEALLLLDRSYPPVPSMEIEPGAVPVELSPMIAYYRAWCRSRLGQDPSADLRRAAGGYTAYLFPYRASSFAVLENAVKLNPNDALAHFLLGRLELHSLNVDAAIAEWRKACAIDPKLPEVHLELAKALIEVKKDMPAAFAVLKEGLSVNPGNADLRSLARSAGEPAGAETSKTAPNLPASPVEIARAALLKAAGGHAGDAAAMFDPKVFPAEKQPDEVRRDYIEVQLQKLLALGRAGDCGSALDQLFKLGDEDSSLAFTLYGFDGYMKAAHFQYYAGVLEAACHDEKNARKRWTRLAKRSETMSSPEYVFPILAAARLDANPARVAAALQAVRGELATADVGSQARLTYLEGMLLAASGNSEESLRKLQQVAGSSGDVWLKYLAALAVRENFNTVR